MFNAQHGDSLNVQISNADNQIVVYLNGSEVFNKSTEKDPPLNEDINLTGQMRTGFNSLLIVGANWGGRSHFKGRVLLKGNDIAEFDRTGGGNGVVWDTNIEINVT